MTAKSSFGAVKDGIRIATNGDGLISLALVTGKIRVVASLFASASS